MKRISIFCGITFLLNALWEIAQTPLYANATILGSYTVTSLSNFHYWLVLLYATAGDLGYVTILYFIVVAFMRDIRWANKREAFAFILFGFFGLIVATLIEWHGLAVDKWTYSALMPIVPILRVGLSPFIQLATTGLVACYFFPPRV